MPTAQVQPITDEQLPKLLAALEEAARADRRTAARFVEPRIGILQETATRRHQFVLGRRGVGKSSLLRKIEDSGTDTDVAVVFIDIETLRDRPYPDVLIEMLIKLLDGLRKRLAPDDWYRLDKGLRRTMVRRRLARLTATLKRLLAQPQVAQRTVRELQSKATASRCGGASASGSGARASAGKPTRAGRRAARRRPRARSG